MPDLCLQSLKELWKKWKRVLLPDPMHAISRYMYMMERCIPLIPMKFPSGLPEEMPSKMAFKNAVSKNP